MRLATLLVSAFALVAASCVLAAAAPAPCVVPHSVWARTAQWPVLKTSIVCVAPQQSVSAKQHLVGVQGGPGAPLGIAKPAAVAHVTWDAALAEPARDAWGRLAAQWVAAQLNSAVNRDAPAPPHVHNTLLDARALLSTHCAARHEINAARAGTLTTRLEAYNSGAAGVASCQNMPNGAALVKEIAKGGSGRHNGGGGDDNRGYYYYAADGDDNAGNNGDDSTTTTTDNTATYNSTDNGDDSTAGGGGEGEGGGERDRRHDATTLLTWYSVLGLVAVFLVGVFSNLCSSRGDW